MKQSIYTHEHLDRNKVKKLVPMFESAYGTHLEELRKQGRGDIADNRLEFATKQHANRQRVAEFLGQSPFETDAQIFESVTGRVISNEALTKLFESYSQPGNITSSGNITNPVTTSTLQGQTWNPNAKAGSGDANTYAFGLQSHIALTCRGFDLIPMVAVDAPKVTLMYTDDIFGGGELDSTEALPSFLDFGCEGVINWELKVTEKLKRGVSTIIFASDKTDGVGFEVRYLVNNNARPFITAQVLSTGKIASGVYTAGDVSDVTMEDAILAINAGTAPLMFIDADGTGTTIKEVALTSGALKVSHTSATRTNLVESTTNRKDGQRMSRKEQKKGVNFKINLSSMDMSVEMMGRQIDADTDNLQIKDMAAIGVNVIARLYNAVNNQVFQAIDTDIFNHLYALGVQHAYNAYLAKQVNYSLFIGVPSTADKPMTDYDAIFNDMMGNDVAGKMGNVKNSIRSSQFENQSTHASILVARILLVSDFIAYQNRQGVPDFLVASGAILSAIKAHSKYIISPFNNTLTQRPELEFSGTLNDLRVYNNNRVEFDDNRILIGRRGTDSDAGAKFVAYDLASSSETIAEGTMSNKLVVWSRYNIVDVGFYPELNYYTMLVHNDNQWS